MADDAIPLTRLLADAPSNWGRWGSEDEIGALNLLDAPHVLRSLSAAQIGKVVSLQRLLGNPAGDPIYPTRAQPKITTVVDDSSWDDGSRAQVSGGMRYADDTIETFLQASTQYDALGHVWYDDQLYNGYSARTTVGGLQKASVEPIARHGVIGSAVLLDVPRHLGVEALEPGYRISLDLVHEVAEAQGSPINSRDILVLRTNYLSAYYIDPDEFWKTFDEPGLQYSPALVEWFHSQDIPNLVTDTIANEPLVDEASGAKLVLHNALMRNLGVLFTELCDLEALARACEEANRWRFLYLAAPIRIHQAAGSPVNPLAVL